MSAAPPEMLTELMTLLDENQETMNANKVRQAMEKVVAITDQWPEPEDSGWRMNDVKRIHCDLEGFSPHDPIFELGVEGQIFSQATNNYRKRKFAMRFDEDQVAGIHTMAGEYLEAKKACRAARVVATCHGFSDATDGECYRRILEGHPRAGWLRCEECGESFCCKRCSVGHSGEDEICTGRCVSISK
jgi:hypothetical protein